MINVQEEDYCGQRIKVLYVDKSDAKHPSRILSIMQTKIQGLPNSERFSIGVAWASGQYAADMNLTRPEVEDFIEKLKDLLK